MIPFHHLNNILTSTQEFGTNRIGEHRRLCAYSGPLGFCQFGDVLTWDSFDFNFDYYLNVFNKSMLLLPFKERIENRSELENRVSVKEGYFAEFQ